MLIVLFAAGIVTYAVASHKNKSAANGGCSKLTGNNSTSYLNELKCAADIHPAGLFHAPSTCRWSQGRCAFGIMTAVPPL